MVLDLSDLAIAGASHRLRILQEEEVSRAANVMKPLCYKRDEGLDEEGKDPLVPDERVKGGLMLVVPSNFLLAPSAVSY